MLQHITKIRENVFVVESSIPEIRYTARSFTIGQEYDLVQSFLRKISNKISKKDKVAIFLEPMIDSGYPDIVIVTYKELETSDWNDARLLLSNTHYKILFEIDKQKKISVSRLSELLGYELSDLNLIITELEKAKLITRKKHSVYRVPYKNYYCVKEITSIEAKIDKWSIAIEQAIHNTRFSNESYVLMRKDRCSESIETKCIDLGIGVLLLNGQLKCPVKAHRFRMPSSYISFVFNEWVTQIEIMEEKK